MPKANRVAIVGGGYSTTGRRTGLTSRQLALQAGKAAMADAGMTPQDIDGVASLWSTAGPAPAGAEHVDALDIATMFGMPALNYFATDPGAVFVAPAIEAVMAIQAGLCHTCITFRIIPQRLSASEIMGGTESIPNEVRGDQQFVQPFGAIMPVHTIAGLPMQRHMAVYGTTEEQFGAYVVGQRYHASLNEEAILRTPLTVEDYLNSRYITKPVRLLDCDYPVDSGSAVIFTTEERARDWKKKPVFVEAMAYTGLKSGGFEMQDDSLHGAPFHTADMLWSRTDLKPTDVDCAQLYDGFTIITFEWLEALGFCKEGEVGPFVEAGHTRLGGSLPVNTDGGACNMGRRHGANFCIEATRQLRGECGVRQIPNAQVSVWANAAGPFAGAMLLTSD